MLNHHGSSPLKVKKFPNKAFFKINIDRIPEHNYKSIIWSLCRRKSTYFLFIMSKTTDNIGSEKINKVSIGSSTFYNDKKNPSVPRHNKTPPKLYDVIVFDNEVKKK